MRALAAIFMTVLMAFAVTIGPSEAQTTPAEVKIVAGDPGLSARLPHGALFYLRVSYRSDEPLWFRARGYNGGREVQKGVMYNPMPAYSRGEGEAMAWIAYRDDVSIDRIAVTASDSAGKVVGGAEMVVRLEWASGAPPRPQPAAWAKTLDQAHQRKVLEQSVDDETGGPLWLGLGLLVMLAVPGYFVLQAFTVVQFSGGWRYAALVPLLGAVPLVIYTLLALATGSNLWPLLLILLSPIGLIYLVGLMMVRRIVTR
jgi:hypothetical protein